MEETEMALPNDALEAIFGRLPPCTLAACRCVCKAWRAVVDARGLLLPHVLPHAVRGIFLNFIGHPRPSAFFARPSPARPGTISGNLGFLPGFGRNFNSILDHCNGLLLYGGASELYVVNPATRRWERLPPRTDASNYLAYLVYDPAVSPHYEVFLIPRVLEKPRLVYPRDAPPTPCRLSQVFSSLGDIRGAEDREEVERSEELAGSSSAQAVEEVLCPTRLTPSLSRWEGELEDSYRLMEWPPSPCTLPVFSSTTRRWEQKPFVREGKAVGTVEDVRLDSYHQMYLGPRRRYSVYWRGALYVHCRGAFVMRLSLTNAKYQVIETPVSIGVQESKYGRYYLGTSEKGVYFATIHDHYQLRVWILNELRGEIKWILMHDIDLETSALWLALHLNNRQRNDGPWILEEYNNDNDDLNDVVPKPYFQWDSDDDNVLDYEDRDKYEHAYIYLLGFHPYKEVIFFMASFTGIAYHLNSSKLQYLGKLYPKDYDHSYIKGVHESFPYTPCMIIGELPGSRQETRPEDRRHDA